MRLRVWHVWAALLASCTAAAVALGWIIIQLLTGALVLLDIIERALNG